MALLITAHFPRAISLPIGTTVQVIGVFAARDRVRATNIMDGLNGIQFHADLQEFDEFQPYTSEKDFTMPLIGQVVNSVQHAAGTDISLHPTGQSFVDYAQTVSAWTRAAVPAYAKILEEKSAWGNAILPLRSVYNPRSDYYPKPLDTSGVIVLVDRAFGKRDGFDARRTASALAMSSKKLSQAERHVERIKIIESLRRHLYLEIKSDARDFHLRETKEEAALASEAAIVSIFSSLDILAHALSEIYGLDANDRDATFFNVVTRRPSTGDEGQEKRRRCLESEFPGDPVTQSLLRHRTRWIQTLSEWRHHIIHHGYLLPGEIEYGVSLIGLPKSSGSRDEDQGTAVAAFAQISEWSANLRELLTDTYSLLSASAKAEIEERAKNTSDNETPEAIEPSKGMSAYEIVRKFLQLWTRTNTEEPERYRHMYGRLSRQWKKEWPYPNFTNFIEKNALESFSIGRVIPLAGGPEWDKLRSVSAVLVFPERSERWIFHAASASGRDMRLIRLPVSTPSSSQRRCTVSEYRSRQSGPETKFQDITFSGVVSNDSEDPLENVVAHICWNEHTEAQAFLGPLAPGEFQPFECNWAKGCVPLGDNPILYTQRGRFRLRVVYKIETSLGDFWAEDLGFDAAST